MDQANAETKTEKQILIQSVYQSRFDLTKIFGDFRPNQHLKTQQKPVSNNTTQRDPAHNNSKMDHFQLYSC